MCKRMSVCMSSSFFVEFIHYKQWIARLCCYIYLLPVYLIVVLPVIVLRFRSCLSHDEKKPADYVLSLQLSFTVDNYMLNMGNAPQLAMTQIRHS